MRRCAAAADNARGQCGGQRSGHGTHYTVAQRRRPRPPRGAGRVITHTVAVSERIRCVCCGRLSFSRPIISGAARAARAGRARRVRYPCRGACRVRPASIVRADKYYCNLCLSACARRGLATTGPRHITLGRAERTASSSPAARLWTGFFGDRGVVQARLCDGVHDGGGSGAPSLSLCGGCVGNSRARRGREGPLIRWAAARAPHTYTH